MKPATRCVRGVVLACVVVTMAFAAACGGNKVKTSEEKAEWHYKLASNFLYDKNPQSALTEAFTAIELNPNHARAHHLIGFIFFGRKDLPRALMHLQLAVRIDPGFDEAVANLGNLYLEMGDWAGAIPYFESLLAKPLYGTPWLAYNNVGWAHYKLGNLPLAERHIQMALFMNPKFCLGFNNLGRVNAHAGQTDKALENFEKATELCPQYAEPHYFLGRIYAALGATDKAKKHFEACHEAAPETEYGKKCRVAQ